MQSPPVVPVGFATDLLFSQKDLEDVFKTNFHGPLNITRALLPRLRAQGTGTLLFMGSQAGWQYVIQHVYFFLPINFTDMSLVPTLVQPDIVRPNLLSKVRNYLSR